MNIQPIVEGYGEVSAVPVLLRRLRDQAEVFELDVNTPIRKKRSELTNETQVQSAVRVAIRQPDCAAVLILFDSDDDCPAELGPQVLQWAQKEAGPVPCAVAIAHREYEAWFLAAMELLRGKRDIRQDANSHPDPESPRDAKGRIEKLMDPKRSYAETSDQPAFTAFFDLAQAHRRSASFRHLVKVFGEIVTALGLNLPTPWVPVGWHPEEEN